MKDQGASIFTSCPVEIAQSVLKFLSPGGLCTLCLVDRNTRAITEPLLYSEINWNWEIPRGADCPPQIAQLVHTLMCRPQLCSYIKHIHFEGGNPRGSQLPKVPVSSTELERAIVFIQGTRLPFSDLWVGELRQGSLDAFVAILLSQLYNLKYLYLGNGLARQTQITGMFLRSAICTPLRYGLPDFRHLQNVTFPDYKYHDEAIDIKWGQVKNTADILPLFYLPIVEHLSVSIRNPHLFTWPAVKAPNSLCLRTLQLTGIREIFLHEVLSVTKGLKTLHWEWFHTDDNFCDDFDSHIADLDRISAAISQVQSTLTELVIIAKLGSRDGFSPGVRIEGSLNAVANWDMLKRLQLPWAFMVGFSWDMRKNVLDVIPRNIELLTITDDLEIQNDDEILKDSPLWEWSISDIVALLRKWLVNWGKYTPNLRGICLRLEYLYCSDDDEWDSYNSIMVPGTSTGDKLEELSAQTGVRIELRTVKEPRVRGRGPGYIQRPFPIDASFIRQ